MWEEIKIVVPFFFSSNNNSTNLFCIKGSNPLVGSSSIKTSGLPIKAVTIPTFCFIPFDIFFILTFVSNSNILSNSSILFLSFIFFMSAIKLM